MVRIIALDSLQQFAAVNLLADLGLIAGQKIVTNCATVTLRFNLASGKVGHVVLGGRYTPPFAVTVAQTQAVFAALSTGGAWTTLATFLSPQTTFAGVDIRNIHLKDQPIISSTGAAVPGTSTGTDMPNEIALAISLKTGLTGPRYRGRAYIPGWATNSLGTTNLVAAGAVNALGSWAGTIQAALAQASLVWCLALPARNAYTSPKTGTHFDARPAETPSITQTVVNNHWDTQRRRGLK